MYTYILDILLTRQINTTNEYTDYDVIKRAHSPLHLRITLSF